MQTNMEQLIKKYHSTQFRNDKENYIPPKVPYVDHLFGVRPILSYALNKFGECKDSQLFSDMCNAALGHDLIEDTNVDEEMIIKSTNDRVLSLIKELTNPVDDNHTDQYMQQLSVASEEARLIKYSDLIENTTSVCFNFHIVGLDWVNEFYSPIVHKTMRILENTNFSKYPKTADFMRSVLGMYVTVLDSKKELVYKSLLEKRD